MKYADWKVYAESIMEASIKHLDYIAGNTIIQFTETDPALLPVDAVVEEQDTLLLLGKTPVIKESVESFPVLVKKMEQQVPEKPGTIIVKNSSPKRFIAIIYDVEQKISICREEWVNQAIIKILSACNKYKINSMAMPLLGMSYGKLDEKYSIILLQNTLIKKLQKHPRKIFIYKPDF